MRPTSLTAPWLLYLSSDPPHQLVRQWGLGHFADLLLEKHYSILWIQLALWFFLETPFLGFCDSVTKKHMEEVMLREQRLKWEMLISLRFYLRSTQPSYEESIYPQAFFWGDHVGKRNILLTVQVCPGQELKPSR